MLASGRAKNWETFFRSYVRTYLERDVHGLTSITDEDRFLTFLKAAAALTGQLLNVSELARDVGIGTSTARDWLSILGTSGLVYLLRPYSRNVTSRIVKTPKLYFTDTDFAAILRDEPLQKRWRTEPWAARCSKPMSSVNCSNDAGTVAGMPVFGSIAIKPVPRLTFS